MARAERVFRNLYRDSVSLMRLSATLSALPGVDQASAVMATGGNLDLLRESGLIARNFEPSPNDLLIAVEGEEEALAAALAAAEDALTRPLDGVGGTDGPRRMAARSLEMALAEHPTANLALISTPGAYAAAEAMKALRLGLNVMLFSDNVELEDEIALKRHAKDHNLLVMGPDCGTAIIGGVPLGFANVVRRGDIGVVAASGTGLQQVTCLIDRFGQGITHAIGTGGHDLHARVGGLTMQEGLAALVADPATRIIVLISKPPDPAIAERILDVAGKAGKPIVVNFIGANAGTIQRPGIHAATTLEEAARLAVALSTGRPAATPAAAAEIPAPIEGLAAGQRYLRGLYSGGTFCYEALVLLQSMLGSAWSNTPLQPERKLADVWRSREHTVLDLGDDAFTRGRPHPMIDQTLRIERILQEAADPEVAVILLDVVLGYGAHPDPGPELAAAIERARTRTANAGRELVVVASVCGTAADPQDLAAQEAALRASGAVLADSNAQAVRLAAEIIAQAVGGAPERRR
jgi:succinyl-CoA synthetase alpha subunit